MRTVAFPDVDSVARPTGERWCGRRLAEQHGNGLHAKYRRRLYEGEHLYLLIQGMEEDRLICVDDVEMFDHFLRIFRSGTTVMCAFRLYALDKDSHAWAEMTSALRTEGVEGATRR